MNFSEKDVEICPSETRAKIFAFIPLKISKKVDFSSTFGRLGGQLPHSSPLGYATG